MTLFKTITHGGQVHIHQLHMLKQILMAGLVVALVAGGGYFAWKSYHLPSLAWRMTYDTYWAKMMLATTPVEKHKTVTQLYIPLKGSPYQRRCINILNDSLMMKTTHLMEAEIKQIAYKSLYFAIFAYLLTMAVWFFFGRAQKRTQHKRGSQLVPWQTLAKQLTRNGEASDIELPISDEGRLNKLPLLKDKETSHFLITGTTGSGKTNLFHSILPQIRARGDRAIILDVTGSYVSRYYNEKNDLILNPLDTRSVAWNPWVDCHLDAHYDVLSESFIQTKEGTKDPFWDNAARAIFKTALRKLAFQRKKNVKTLTTFLLSSTDKEFEDFFKGTEAATFAFKNNDKTTQSIRSILSSQIEALRQLEAKNKGQKAFSIRNWVMDENKKGCIFITARPDQRETLKPLISAWMDIAINALMVLSENQKRRVWFIMDELTALQRLPRLQAGLAEGRKYGGCFLVGFQSKPQLENIYGRNSAETMLDLFNTKVFFRCSEPSTQNWISKVIGDKEEVEPQENISFGAHSMRDGVSLSRHIRQTPLVMPTELSQLKDLECYLKYPGDYPSTKMRTEYQNPPALLKEPFLLRTEKKRKYVAPAINNFEEKNEELI